MKALQLRDLIIRPTLDMLGLGGVNVEQLMLATCAQESNMGEFIAQVHGPALGIFEMEPPTYNDLIFYLGQDARHNLKERILGSLFAVVMPAADALVWNLRLSVIMARLLYLRAPKALPEAGDLNGLWNYYKVYYNSIKGAATKEQFIANYNKYVTPLYLE